MAKRRKKSESQQVDEDLDKACGYYIKLRDAWHIEDDEGKETPYNKCFTCGVIKPAIGRKGLQWGHFVERSVWAIRWDEKNAHPQCEKCNVFKSGEQFLHGKAIDRKYGKGTADELMKFKTGTAQKPPITERRKLLNYFIQQLENLGYEYRNKRVHRKRNGTPHRTKTAGNRKARKKTGSR